jgi:hypothetical protein
MIRLSRLPLALVSTLLLSTFVTACGDDEDTTTDSGSTQDISTPDTGGGDGGGTGCETPDSTHSTQTYRVTNVSIEQPGGIGLILEGLINQDIGDGLLHILIRAKDFDANCGDANFQATGNAGQVLESGEYDWFEGVTVEYKPATLGADGSFTNTEVLSIIFPALVPGDPEPLQIPVDDIILSGLLGDSGSGPTIEAILEGVIYEDRIQDIPPIELTPGADPRPLADLLGRENQDVEGDRPGWNLRAAVQAVAVTAIADIE